MEFASPSSARRAIDEMSYSQQSSVSLACMIIACGHTPTQASLRTDSMLKGRPIFVRADREEQSTYGRDLRQCCNEKTLI